MNSKFVCHICPSFDNSLYKNLVECLIRDGYPQRVFYFTSGGSTYDEAKDYVDFCTPFNKYERLFFRLKSSLVIKKYLSFYDPENISLNHAHTLFSSAVTALYMKKKYQIPYITAVRGVDLNIFFKYRLTLRRLGIKILDEASYIIFLSSVYRDTLINQYVPADRQAVFREKSRIIPNGISDFWLDHKADAGKRLVDRRRINYIYFGDMDRNKNVATTVKACQALIDLGYEVHLVLIGKMKSPFYQKMIENNPFIQYIGFSPKERLLEYLKESTIFIMPSKSETFGLSYVESMSQGIPVIYSKGQGFDGQFEEGTVGYHVQYNSVPEIIDATLNILGNYEEISRNCIKAADQFRWSMLCKSYEEMYQELGVSQL